MPRWSTPNARDRLLRALNESPGLTQREAIDKLGISRQRLHQLSKELGVYIPPSPREGIPSLNLEAGPKQPLYAGMSPYVAAYVAETAVSFDLLKRGYDVYRSITYCGACDIIAVHRGTEQVVRIEVKTARKSASGSVRHSPAHKNKFDVLALVTSDEIIYRPELPQFNYP